MQLFILKEYTHMQLIYVSKCSRLDAGGPYEYLHSPQAMHLSNATLFSNVQNLQDQTLNFEKLLALLVPQASHISADGCNNIKYKWCGESTFRNMCAGH
jgi:hypothetical protein